MFEEMGRAPFDSKFCAAWRALFESFVPIGRGMAPVCRHLIRSRAEVLQGAPRADQEDVSAMGCGAAAFFVKLGVSPAELGAPLRAYVDANPPSVDAAGGMRSELVGPFGALETLGVVAGVVFAMVTRPSYDARLKWFQKLDWWRVSCLLRGLAPRGPGGKSVQKSRPGFVEITNKDCFDEQYGRPPVQPYDKSRLWEVTSFAALPTFEGKFRADAAQQCGFRMPTLSDYEKGTNSGARLAVADPDAGVTVPGVVPDSGDREKVRGRSLVKGNAALLAKGSAVRIGDHSSDPSASGELLTNARKYAGRCALEAGFRRCPSRVGVPNARASWFGFDVPAHQASAEWLSYMAINVSRL